MALTALRRALLTANNKFQRDHAWPCRYYMHSYVMFSMIRYKFIKLFVWVHGSSLTSHLSETKGRNSLHSNRIVYYLIISEISIVEGVFRWLLRTSCSFDIMTSCENTATHRLVRSGTTTNRKMCKTKTNIVRYISFGSTSFLMYMYLKKKKSRNE